MEFSKENSRNLNNFYLIEFSCIQHSMIQFLNAEKLKISVSGQFPNLLIRNIYKVNHLKSLNLK